MPKLWRATPRKPKTEATGLHGRAVRVQGAAEMKTLILLTLLHAGATGADAFYTNQNMESRYGAVEHNRMISPFVQTRGSRIAFFSADVGIHFGAGLLLHRKHHDRLVYAVMGEGIADSTYGAVQSARNPR